MKNAPVKKMVTVLGAGSLLLGAVLAAPAASAATPTATAAATASATASLASDSPQAVGARTALVNAWYEQFLGRTAIDDAGSGYWVVRLRTEEPSAVLTDLLHTREAVTKQVDDLYTTFLHRGIEGDPGADYWIDGIQRGAFPAEWAEQNILASPEYQQLNNEADREGEPKVWAQLVPAWYRDVLGRSAEPGERMYWVNQLYDSTSLAVLRRIWYSPEAVDLRIASHYRDYLQRDADGGEIAYWSGAEVAGDADVVIAIASSAEYQQNAATFLP